MSNIISYLINIENRAICSELKKEHKIRNCVSIKRDIHAIDKLMQG